MKERRVTLSLVIGLIIVLIILGLAADSGDMEEVLVFLGIVLGIAVLIFQIFAAWAFYQVAKDKGYDEARYWVLPFFFPIAGYILVAALPDRGAVTKKSEPNNDLPDRGAVTEKSEPNDDLPDDLPEI